MSDKKKLSWKISEDGYHYEVKLFDDATGRIVGVVRGSTFQKQNGWDAHAEEMDSAVHLGRYETVDQGKVAVQKYWTSKGIPDERI